MPNETRPLLNKKIVVTRAARQAGALSELLREHGAVPVEVPLIDFRSVVTVPDAQRMLKNLAGFDWIVFTSSNAVRFFLELVGDRQLPKDIRLACVGDKTAAILGGLFRRPDFVPTKFSSECLANELPVIPGQKILYPGPVAVASDLVSLLESRDAEITWWPVYQTVAVCPRDSEMHRLKEGVDAVTFASPSAVDSFCRHFTDPELWLHDWVVACIGPLTRQRADDHGLHVDLVPDSFTIFGMVEALEQHFDTQKTRRES